MFDEVKEEFEKYSCVDYGNLSSIGKVYSTFGYGEGRTGNRGFGIIVKRGFWETEAGILRSDKLKQFGLLLKEHGNLNYARKTAWISGRAARYYADILNAKASEIGVLPLFIRYNRTSVNRKLTEKQVTYIKYLSGKYSSPRVAAMYSVSPATIQQIKNGFTYKHVTPAIVSDVTFRIVNQYHRVVTEKVASDSIVAIPSHSQLLLRIQTNRWGTGKIICPFCKRIAALKYNDKLKSFKCLNKKCDRRFSPTAKTIYEGTKITLDKWWVIEKKMEINAEVSSYKLAMDLNLTQKTVWQIMNKIRQNIIKSLILSDFDAPINI